jgi:polysaccharide chain length determinant protein (PEP-CTERM system associated)
MKSRPQLEKTAQMADLNLAAKTPEEHERLIASLDRRIVIAKGGDNIFGISFEDSNRATAELVVNTLLENFLEDARGERRTDSSSANAFVDQQIADYEKRLNEAEQRRAAFKRDNIGLMPGETGDYYTRLQKSMQTLAETRAQLRLALERQKEYQQQLEGEQPVFGVVTASGGDDAQSGANDALIAQYEGDLNTLLLKYTENHPDVIALKETIERLKKQRQAEGAARPSGLATGARGNTTPLEANPVYQRMRMGLSETDVDIATLKSKLAAEEKDVQDLQKLVDTIPEIERQLTAMNRDYEVTRDQYETLLKRRESLRITGEVEQSGDQLQFRVLDPPRASLRPVGPNRPFFLGGIAVVALGAAAVLGFVLQQLNPAFMTRRELRELTGLPVLGAISLARGPEERAASKRRLLVFGAAAAALPAALAIAVLLQEPAHRLVASVLSVLHA